ncbi:MAG TPA: superinfection immunity protein [Rhizomicrobium sp.]|jgi:hypothetical protein|nr:superinfection immunity protein [Rhizomicrobium sp.]
MFGSGFLTAVFVLVIAFILFLPTFIAARRHHRDRIGIFLLNLIFGWSGIGWLAALIWSIAPQPPLKTNLN